jgi:hypothetical protein
MIMFSKPTMFIVGAGASFDYRMPLGADLVAGTAAATDFWWEHHVSHLPSRGDQALFENLQRRCGGDKNKINLYVRSGQMLASSLSSAVSIDDALYQLSEFPEVVELGKVCISRTILEAESKSALKISADVGHLPSGAGKDGWIEQMFSMAITGLKQNEFRKKAFAQVTFINFNYDRCIEHYIFWALQRQGIPASEAEATVAELNMIRPYGSLGSVIQGTKDYLPFGQFMKHQDYFPLTNRIRTYTESEVMHDKEVVERLVSEASMFIFLGFGFHRQNLELLRARGDLAFRASKILATVFRVHPANVPELHQNLQALLKVERSAELLSMEAAEILKELRMKIMMAVG